MVSSPVGIFQFEGNFAFDSLKKFNPKSIFDMSLVTACIRPTGASYRDSLLARVPHKNPSEMIDRLLENNLGYLVYQEDTIAFLQQICGLSGSEADNIRRAIGRKQKDRLDKAMPQILEGYCSRSSKPRDEAEQEAKEFLQVIEDSASYQFGYNHSIAYCLLGYLCAYYRYYYPFEFLTAFLNNAANDDDIRNGTAYANKIGIKVTIPKWGFSKSDFFYDKEKKTISKGLSSVKFFGNGLAEKLFELAHSRDYLYFSDVLWAIYKERVLDTRQVDILIKIDFFSDFGNQRELQSIADLFYNTFHCGERSTIDRSVVDGTYREKIVKPYVYGKKKDGTDAKRYTILDFFGIMHGFEEHIKSLNLDDLDNKVKVENFKEAMGYYGYASGKEEDRRRLYITDMTPLKRKKDGKQFGYSIFAVSVGSGKESRYTLFNRVYNKEPIKKGDVIYCTGYARDGQYFTLTSYYPDW